MFTARLLCIASLALACGREAPKSTPLPTPESSPLKVVLAPGDGLEPRSLAVTGGFLLLEGCTMSTGGSLFLPDETDLSGMETSLLGGNWCQLTISLGEQATLKAISHRGDWLNAALGGAEIVLQQEDGFAVSGESYILELGAPGWLEPTALGMTTGSDRSLTSEDPETALLLDALLTGSALYEDLDGNGILGSAERSEVRASPSTPEPEDTGSPDTGGPDTGEADTGPG
jgi:hypothetical protein